jgi:malate dehydrogenase (oxaloacetate-decarboxylating)
MRLKPIPFLAPNLKKRRNGQGPVQTKARGPAILNTPLLNKGTAFTELERSTLGLTGLLPPESSTLDIQVKRAYIRYDRLSDVLSKNVYLTALHDRNEILFYRLFSEHLREMIPVVNDLTVGQAIEHYPHEFRRPRGLYLSIRHMSSIETAFDNIGAGSDEIDLILATDAEGILGIGDAGVGGIEVAIGKLAIYTAAAGIDPARVIPVMLDTGTNKESLLEDPLYVGNRHPRIRGERYDEFIKAYVETATRKFPNAILIWEDFTTINGKRILDKYREKIRTFNDDIQGTGAITLAAAISAVRVAGMPLGKQRIVIYGAGDGAIGVARQLYSEMRKEGSSSGDALDRFWCLDQKGLLTGERPDASSEIPSSFFRPSAESKNWQRGVDEEGKSLGINLAEVVHRVWPTMLIGVSGEQDAFGEEMIREMAQHAARPIVFVLSTPLSRCEATPTDLVAWTEGRGLIATRTFSPPVTYKGLTHVIAHITNTLLYPGLALGTTVAKASRISDGMIAAAASAVSSLVSVRQPGASLLPQMDDLRTVSLTVAVAVAETAEKEGISCTPMDDIVQMVQDAMWQPEYRPIEAI